MNKQQQELYDKLLKKVNEYCLGQAAEDVIEAIDNLVDTYETPKVDTATIENYRKRMKEWQSGHSVDFSKVRFEVQNLLPDPDDIGKRLKALEIIKRILHYSYTNRFIVKQAFDEGWINEEQYQLMIETFGYYNCTGREESK